MHEDRFRVGTVHALGDACQEHSNRVIGTAIVTVEVEAVGGLRPEREVNHALPELFDIVERRDFVVEVVSRHVPRGADRIHSVIKHLPKSVEFEQP